MTESPVNKAADLGQKQDSVRHVLADFFNQSYSHELPVEWENMPPLSPLPSEGWVRFRIDFDQVAPVGLMPSIFLQRGHLRLTVAVAIGHGMAEMDRVTIEITTLFAGRTIENIHLGHAALESPARQRGFHLRAIDIGFIANLPAPSASG